MILRENPEEVTEKEVQGAILDQVPSHRTEVLTTKHNYNQIANSKAFKTKLDLFRILVFKEYR